MSRRGRKPAAETASPAPAKVSAPLPIAADLSLGHPQLSAARLPHIMWTPGANRPPRQNGVAIGTPSPAEVLASTAPVPAPITAQPVQQAPQQPPQHAPQQPPQHAPQQPPQQAPQPAAPPYAAAPPAAGPVFAPPEGQNNFSHAANAYADQARAHAGQRWQRAKDIPQGENLLVAAWAAAVASYPPYALTLLLVADDSSYELVIPGDSLAASDYPDRQLYGHMMSVRRRPSVNEKFTGRIRALMANGAYLDVGAGRIALPPVQEAPAQQWAAAQPAWGAGGYGQWGPPGWTPPVAGAPMPPWMMGTMGPMGMGWGGGGGPGSMLQMLAAEVATLRQQVAAKPPAEIQGNPALVEMWRATQEIIAQQNQRTSGAASSQNELTGKLIDRMFTVLTQQQETAADRNGAADPFSTIEKVVTIMDKLRGPVAEQKGGITIHKVGEATLLEDSKGDLDIGGSVLLSALGDAKKIVGAIAARRGMGVTGGSGNRPPAGNAPPAQPEAAKLAAK